MAARDLKPAGKTRKNKNEALLTIDEYIKGFSLAETVRKNARTRPDAPALVFEQQTLTYKQLDVLSSRAANALMKAGVRAGDRVAFLGKNVPEYFTFHFGAAKLNAVLVGINWRLTPPEMSFILNDADVKVLVIESEYLSYLGDMKLAGDPLIIAIGAQGDFEGYDDWISGQSDKDPNIEADLNDTAVQVYTSGTTGHPKGAEISHRNIGACLWAWTQINGLTSKGVILHVLPMFHIGGSSAVYMGLWMGCANIVRRELDPGDMLASIDKYRVTHIMAVPAILQLLSTLPSAAQLDLSSVELVQYGASPISQEVLNSTFQLFGCPLLQTYGLTEATGPVSYLPPEDHDPTGPRAHLMRSAGKPIPGTDIRIVGPDGNDCAPGEVGEILTRSLQNMKGYWKNPEATASAFPEGRDPGGLGWMATGDAGSLEDGYLYIRDRVKDMIVSGAENIYPAEIENALMSHPDIADAAVIGVPSKKWGETPLAFIVPVEKRALQADEIIAFCAERLARYKLPSKIEIISEVPRNASGKIQKTELRKPYWQGRERAIN